MRLRSGKGNRDGFEQLRLRHARTHPTPLQRGGEAHGGDRDRELEVRSSLLPQQRAELQARKQRLSARVQVLDGASRVMSSVLVDLELRRRVLREEITRRLSEGGQ